MTASQAFGAGAGYSIFYIPADEYLLATVLEDLQNNDSPTRNTHALIAVTAWADDTVVYVDHWEDGYEFDPDNPVDFDESYTLVQGGAQNFETSNIALIRTADPSQECVENPGATPDPNDRVCPCDGRDIIYAAGGSATVTRAGWLEQGNTYQAVAWEVYPVRPQLIKYILPFGEDLNVNPAPGLNDFERVYAFVQATNNNTIIQIDFDADGTYDSFDHDYDGTLDGSQYVLNKGDVYLLTRDSDGVGGTLNTGTTILGSETIQVQYIIGDQGSTFEVRGLSAFPRGFWDNEYYAPVDDADDATETDIFLYNPHTDPLTINWETAGGAGNFILGANTTEAFNAQAGAQVPNAGAVYLSADDVFWGVSTIDTEAQGNDWAYSLVPAALLDVEYYMGWAPSYDFSQSTPPQAADEQCGLFITAAQDHIVVWIDENNDGIIDQNLSIDRLDTVYVNASDGAGLNDDDLSQARILSTGPYALAYGQNPDTAVPGDTTALDLGYTVLPTTDKWFELVLDVEKDVNPAIVAANTDDEQTTFTLEVSTYEYTVSGLTVTDSLPEDWEYVDDSTTITLPDGTSSSGNSFDPTITGTNPYTLTWSGTDFGTYGTTMGEHQTITIVFTAQTIGTGFDAGDLTLNEVEAVGTRTVETVTQTFRASDFAFVSFADSTLDIEKTTGGIDPLSPGDIYTYTVDVTNPYYDPAAGTFTDVAIYDPLPPGISYNAGTSVVTITSRTFTDVADDFSGGQIYNNTSGTVDWSTYSWAEIDNVSGDATDGSVLIPSGEAYVQISGVSGGSNGIQRQVNLSSASEAYLSLDYSYNGNVTSADELILSISDDGGTSWTELARFSDAVESFGQAIDAYLASNTIIRLVTDTGDFNASGGTMDVEDDFSSQIYNNTSGSISWAANSWAETNDDNSATAGYIQVRGGPDEDLQFEGVSGDSVSIQRSANLTGASSATLTLEYTPDSTVDSDDELFLEVSQNGSAPFTVLETFTDSSGPTSFSGSITGYIGASTTIRLRTNTGDFVETGSSGTAASDNFGPARLYTQGTGWWPAEGWVEDGESDGPTGGDLRINNGLRLVLRDLGGLAIARRADLSASTGWSSASISFNIRGLELENDDELTVQICSDAALPGTTISGSWQDIETISGNSFSTDDLITYTTTAGDFDLADLTSSFALRFLISNLSQGDRFQVDNVVIAYTVAGSSEPARVDNVKIEYTNPDAAAKIDNVRVDYVTAASTTTVAPTVPYPHAAPNFVQSGENHDLDRGDSMTLTFDVTVDDPLATGIDEIDNTAYITAFELVVPLSDDATNIVNNPSSATGEVGDLVWLDTNGDGDKDPGEPGLSNVEVTLKDEFGTPLAVINTDGNGQYSFTGITPGNDYFVEVTGGLPAGLEQSYPLETTPPNDPRDDNRTNPFNLSAGQVYLDADLGYTTPAGTGTIGDLVWYDEDGDGNQNGGEMGLAGVTVQLYRDVDGDGIFEAGGDDGAAIDSVETVAGGSYLFANVDATDGVGTDDYFVYVDNTQAALTDYFHTTPASTQVADLADGDARLTNDFGFDSTTIATYTYRDRVWFEADKDKDDDDVTTTDNGETGIAEVTVNLLDSSRNVLTTETTDPDGYFEFSGLTGGTFYYAQVSDTNGKLTDYFGTTAEAIAGEYQMPIISGNIDFTDELGTDLTGSEDPNFGYNADGAIGDTVFNDNGGGTPANAGNGIQDSGEPGLANVTVTLYTDDGGGTPANAGNGVIDAGESVVGTLETDANGNYMFSGLADGDYIVSIGTTPTGFSYTGTGLYADTDGTAAGEQLMAVIIGGNSDLTRDFGYQATDNRSVSGTIWSDIDNDGNDEGDFDGGSYLDDVTVELRDSGGSLVETVTTNTSGYYEFLGLPSATYTVRVTDTDGILNGYTTTYEVSAIDGEEDVDLSSGNVANVNFGYYKPPVVTRAVISEFSAFNEDGKVVVRWQTVSEHGTVGFYLYRLNTNTGKYKAVNKKLLPGLLNSPVGGWYSYEDKGAKTGAYYTYRLEEVEVSGNRITYGPWKVFTGTPLLGEQAVIELDAHASIAGFRQVQKPLSDKKIARLTARMDARLEAYAKKMARKGVRAKIYVEEEGLYFIDANDIATVLDVDFKKIINQIKFNNVRLRCMGQRVAVLPAEDNSGLYFYGERRETRYSDENVYWLDFHNKPLEIREVNRAPKKPAEDVQYFYQWVWEEEDNHPLVAVFSNPEDDFWMWDYVFPGYGRDQVTLSVFTPGVVDIENASLTVTIKGATEAFAGNDHHAVISVNGHVVGDAVWDGLNSTVISVPVATAILNDGENLVEIAGIQVSGVPYNMFFIDDVQVVYPRTYTALDNQLTAENNGYLTMRMGGFTDPDIRVFDITDPRRPNVLAKTVVEPSVSNNGAFQVSFRAGNVFRRYLAVTPEMIKPCTLIADQPSYLKKRLNLGDYLIITSSDMVAAAQSLADYRAAQGHVSKVVDVEDIYDEFSNGVVDAEAIREFLAYAYSKWRIPPKYVLLAGDGSFDYKDHQGFGDSIIPPLLTGNDARDGLSVTDAFYADVAGNDGIPEFAIGRIPVISADELLDYTNKVIGYESSGGTWINQAIFAADSPDSGGDFISSSEDVAALFPDIFSIDRLYMDQMTLPAARLDLINGINDGRLFVNFIGHGAPQSIGNQNLFSTDDLVQLNNGMRLPVFTAMTCLTGSFGYPGRDGLNEALVLKPDGGAIAMWAPSGFAFNSQSVELCKGFYSAVFIGGEKVLGDAIRRSQESYANRGEAIYHLDLYNLIGDPALKLK